MSNYTATPQDKSNYIIKLIKSVGKDLKHAIDSAVWYTNTDREQKQVEQLIQDNWSK